MTKNISTNQKGKLYILLHFWFSVAYFLLIWYISVRILKFQEDIMKLSDCKFSENDIKQLQDYRDRQEDFRLKLRFMAILSAVFNKDGIGNAAAVFGKHIETIKNWLFLYLTEGPEKLNSFNYKPKQPYLNRYQINQVIIFVTYENPAAVKEVMSYINDEFSVSYSHEAVRQLLIKNGLKLLRPVKIPGNPPSPEIQKNC